MIEDVYCHSPLEINTVNSEYSTRFSMYSMHSYNINTCAFVCMTIPMEVLYVDLLVTGLEIISFLAGHHGLICVQLTTQIWMHTYSPGAISLMVTSKLSKFIAGHHNHSDDHVIHRSKIPMHVHPPGGSTELVVTNRMCFVGSHKARSPGFI